MLRGTVTFVIFCAVVAWLGVYSGVAGALNEIAFTAQEYEIKSLQLLAKNRALSQQVQQLEFALQEQKSKNNFLEIKLAQRDGDRTIASIPKLDQSQDKVSFDVFEWSEQKLLAIGIKAYKNDDFDKASQYLNELLKRYPDSELINDQVLYMAGVASYRDEKYEAKHMKGLEQIIAHHPSSAYFRSAKLWLALAKLHRGEQEDFFNTVEEFRLKYRNTDEWKILSRYYEEFAYRYQN